MSNQINNIQFKRNSIAYDTFEALLADIQSPTFLQKPQIAEMQDGEIILLRYKDENQKSATVVATVYIPNSGTKEIHLEVVSEEIKNIIQQEATEIVNNAITSVSVKVNPNDKILSEGDQGLQTSLQLSLTGTNLKLVGKDNQAISAVNLPTPGSPTAPLNIDSTDKVLTLTDNQLKANLGLQVSNDTLKLTGKSGDVASVKLPSTLTAKDKSITIETGKIGVTTAKTGQNVNLNIYPIGLGIDDTVLDERLETMEGQTAGALSQVQRAYEAVEEVNVLAQQADNHAGEALIKATQASGTADNALSKVTQITSRVTDLEEGVSQINEKDRQQDLKIAELEVDRSLFCGFNYLKELTKTIKIDKSQKKDMTVFWKFQDYPKGYKTVLSYKISGSIGTSFIFKLTEGRANQPVAITMIATNSATNHQQIDTNSIQVTKKIEGIEIGWVVFTHNLSELATASGASHTLSIQNNTSKNSPLLVLDLRLEYGDRPSDFNSINEVNTYEMVNGFKGVSDTVNMLNTEVNSKPTPIFTDVQEVTVEMRKLAPNMLNMLVTNTGTHPSNSQNRNPAQFYGYTEVPNYRVSNTSNPPKPDYFYAGIYSIAEMLEPYSNLNKPFDLNTNVWVPVALKLTKSYNENSSDNHNMGIQELAKLAEAFSYDNIEWYGITSASNPPKAPRIKDVGGQVEVPRHTIYMNKPYYFNILHFFNMDGSSKVFYSESLRTPTTNATLLKRWVRFRMEFNQNETLNYTV